MDCFFQKVKLIDIKIIKGFDDLRWDDQQKVRDLIQKTSSTPSGKRFRSQRKRKRILS